MFRDVIIFSLANFTITFAVAGLVFATAAIMRLPKPRTLAAVTEKLLSWFIFWTIGVAFFYNFVFHVFFGKAAAAFIGWADSPFQLEVGMASLGCSVVGFIAAFRSFDMRLAAILTPGIFMIGAAAGHVYQMVTAHNFAPGNAGVMFWSDVLLPGAWLTLLLLHRRAVRVGCDPKSLAFQPA